MKSRPIDFIKDSKQFRLKKNVNLPVNYLPTLFGTWMDSDGKFYNNKQVNGNNSTLTGAGLNFKPYLFESRLEQALFEGWVLIEFEQSFGGFKLEPNRETKRILRFLFNREVPLAKGVKKRLIAMAAFYNTLFKGKFEYQVQPVSFPPVDDESLLFANFLSPVKVFNIRVLSMYL